MFPTGFFSGVYDGITVIKNRETNFYSFLEEVATKLSKLKEQIVSKDTSTENEGSNSCMLPDSFLAELSELEEMVQTRSKTKKRETTYNTVHNIFKIITKEHVKDFNEFIEMIVYKLKPEGDKATEVMPNTKVTQLLLFNSLIQWVYNHENGLRLEQIQNSIVQKAFFEGLYEDRPKMALINGEMRFAVDQYLLTRKLKLFEKDTLVRDRFFRIIISKSAESKILASSAWFKISFNIANNNKEAKTLDDLKQFTAEAMAQELEDTGPEEEDFIKPLSSQVVTNNRYL